MQRFIRLVTSLMNRFGQAVRRPSRFVSRRQIIAGASLLAMMFLSCVSGAAIIYYDLRPAFYLKAAFMGFSAWKEHGKDQLVTSIAGETQLGISRDELTKTFDGFTLYTTTQGTNASLIDMRGNLVHQWSRPFSDVWPHPTHVKHPLADDQVHWFRCRLFPNGDLLAIYQADADTPHGYGLAKLDKDSKLLWSYSDNVHHDLDIGDDGKIYTLTHQISNELMKGLDSITPPYLADYVVILSPEGKELEKISILEAFQHSPFSLFLSSISAGEIRMQSRAQLGQLMPGMSPPSAPMPGTAPPGPPMPGKSPPGPPNPGNTPSGADQTKATAIRHAQKTMPPMSKESGDVLHANSVRVLNRAMASKFPLFKEGQVLISLCYLNTIAVLDVPTRSIVWATPGVWLAQHDSEFLDNGHLLLFDNSGQTMNSRVIEFDPVTYGYPWVYANEDSTAFVASHRGMKQRLPNGNILIVDPDGGRLFEVTSAKSLVWEYGCAAKGDVQDAHAIVTSALRYPSTELKFLTGVPVRP
jgi:hypothetical protein